MNGKKNMLAAAALVVSVSLIACAVSVLLVSRHYSRVQFALLNAVCGKVVEQEPKTRYVILAALKEYTTGNPGGAAKEDLLSALGYQASDFTGAAFGQQVFFTAAGFLAGMLLFLFAYLYRNHRQAGRARALAAYLEQANIGRAAVLSACGEDDFSKLEDEIYKTVTFLYQTKDSAVQAKNEFAKNLSNIAHQIKTPITAISLSVQMLRQDFCSRHLEQVEKQLLRLAHLEEALLALSRMDAGTLLLQKDEVDIFTLLVLAADHLQELSARLGTSVDIPELGEMMAVADLDWTMEAMMNLMKNCIEHNPGGTVFCSYAQNPLYTQILIWDHGEGFAKEDIPHLFERFYRGRNAKEGSIGIGLALSKEIIERQNGTICAKNMPGGGALFEIRFYCH